MKNFNTIIVDKNSTVDNYHQTTDNLHFTGEITHTKSNSSIDNNHNDKPADVSSSLNSNRVWGDMGKVPSKTPNMSLSLNLNVVKGISVTDNDN